MTTSVRQRDALQAADQAVVWFAVLRRAQRCRDNGLVGRAVNELLRLGVHVFFFGVEADESAKASHSLTMP